MKKVSVIKTENYKRCYNKLDGSVKKLVDKQEAILIKTGGMEKPLYGSVLFERKVKNHRIYYSKKKKRFWLTWETLISAS